MMSKPRPVFSDMPLLIKENIVNLADPISKFSIRQCSKHLCFLVSKSPSIFKTISFQIETGYIILKLVTASDELSIEYYREKLGCWLVVPKKGIETYFRNKDFLKRAISDFLFIIRNPEDIIEKFKISPTVRRFEEYPGFPEVKNAFFRVLTLQLSLLTHKIHVSNIALTYELNTEQILQVLSHLKPGALEDIKLTGNGESTLVKLTRLDQWKEAKSLVMLEEFRNVIPISKLLHFENVCLTRLTLSQSDLKALIFANQNQPNFKTFTLCKVRYNHNELIEVLEPLEVVPPITSQSYYQEAHLPNNGGVIGLKVLHDCIEIVRPDLF